MANKVDEITKVSISFNCFFQDNPRGGQWIGLPPDIKNLLQLNEGTLTGITDQLYQDKEYILTIIIQRK